MRAMRMVQPLSRNTVAAVATVVAELRTPVLVVFEVLHRPLVLFGGGAAAERAEVSALAGSRVGFSRVQAVFARAEFANHGDFPFFVFRAPRAPRQTALQSTRRSPAIPAGRQGSTSGQKSGAPGFRSRWPEMPEFYCFRW